MKTTGGHHWVATLCFGSLAILIGLLAYINLANFISGEAKVGKSTVIKLEHEVTKLKDIYDVTYQEDISKELQAYKTKDKYDFNNMLLVYNPFQLNVQSMYVYFQTKEEAALSYTIHVDQSDIVDFTRTLYNGEKNNATKEHEYQIIGLVPGMKNEITFTLTYKSGKTKLSKVTFTPDELSGKQEIILSQEDGVSTQELSDGLYAVFSEDKYLYYYDNDGIIRSEIPILGYRALRLLFQDDKMYYSINKSNLVEMNSLGQITRVYNLGQYHLHHDYVFDDKGNILILGTDTKADSIEDRVLKLNLATGKVKELINLADYYQDYYEANQGNIQPDGDYDWMHLNTIQYIGKNQIILSARETSAIIKIAKIYKSPTIKYMLSEASFWEGTGYENLLYDKTEEFRSHTGQHTVTYEPDDSLKSSQYYLTMYNNNVGKSYSRPDYDWNLYFEDITDSGKNGTVSYYYKYLVDEKAKTYELVEAFPVTYSGYVSSTQQVGDNILVDSGQAFEFSEYDEDRDIIRTFHLNGTKYCYRVYKYSFNNFYFYEK